ncbi:MAG: ParB/RepB/Spo0J family partition protein [Weeksellaceae bacterium]
MKTLQELFSSLQSEKDIFQKSRIIRHLRLQYEVPAREIAEKLSVHPSYVSHYLRLLTLPEIVIDGFYAKQVSASHLFILARLQNKEEVMEAYKEILEKGYTSAQTEELIREKKYALVGEDADYFADIEIKQLVTELKKFIPDLDVKITQTRIQGSIHLSIKGKRAKTTHVLRTLLQRLADVEEEEDYDESRHLIYLDETAN